ncbi:MAG: glycosyltransferase family 2 protein [Pseudomonadota bacterium]
MSGRPYFSIGVTTFDRRELLNETLKSILGQTFGDFEVLVGNDNPSISLTPDVLGISDPRIRILNHPINLGEIGNMNELLAQSRGAYFTWLADDDLYATTFLQAVRDAHLRHEAPTAVFTNYDSGTACQPESVDFQGRVFPMEGRVFLRKYLSRNLRTLGCYGVFESRYLHSLGGMTKLGNGFSPYSDNLLAIRAGALEKLCYIDAPLLFFRTHPDSISYSSDDVEAYATAQEDLCAHAIQILDASTLQSDRRRNIYDLLSHWCLIFISHVLMRSDRNRGSFYWRYAKFLYKYSSGLGSDRVRLFALTLKLALMHEMLALMGKLSSRPR